MLPIATFINTAAVLAGSAVGLILQNRYPQRVKRIFFQAMGLVTLVIGMKMAFEVENILVLVFSLIIGGFCGELLMLEERIDRSLDGLKRKISADSGFSEGLITGFLIFCIGSMTIVGAIDEGLRGDRTLLLTKSVMDGFTSVALASTYGIGVLFSAVPLLLFQGSITLLAATSRNLFTSVMIAQLTAVGGTLIIGIGINLLEIKKIRVINILPALVIVVLLTRFTSFLA